MTFELSFETEIDYNAGVSGISLDVELRLGEVYVNVAAKLDTGSTHCIFAKQYADTLGIEVETGDPLRISTVRGSFLTFGHPLTLVVAGYEFDSTIFFAVDESISRNVLGRRGWLDRVIIGINDYDGKLYLKRYNQ